MAWEIVSSFPEVPSHMDINSSMSNMEKLRQKMAGEILTASGDGHEWGKKRHHETVIVFCNPVTILIFINFLVFRKDECCAFCGLTQPLGGGPTTDWVSTFNFKG